MQQRAGLRLLLAVGLSAALHLSLIYGVAVNPSLQSTGPPILAARLIPAPVTPRSTAALEPKLPELHSGPRPATTPVSAFDLAPAESSPIAESGDSSPAVASEPVRQSSQAEPTTLPAAQIPLLSDPIWYAARDIDVYPRPLTAWDLEYSTTAGEVALLARIDEYGVVQDATVLQAEPAGRFEESALSAVKAARFAPAELDGRAVRSQIVLKLRYGPRMQAGAER